MTAKPLSDEYLDERFLRVYDRIEADKGLFEQRFGAAEQTLTVAKQSLNEMRGMASDAQAAFLTKSVYDARHSDLANQIRTLTEKQGIIQADIKAIIAANTGMGGAWHNIGVIVSIGIALSAVIATLWSAHAR